MRPEKEGREMTEKGEEDEDEARKRRERSEGIEEELQHWQVACPATRTEGVVHERRCGTSEEGAIS